MAQRRPIPTATNESNEDVSPVVAHTDAYIPRTVLGREIAERRGVALTEFEARSHS